MTPDFATSQLLQARDYLVERGFSAATLTAMRTRMDLPDHAARSWDVVWFDQSTGRWAAYTTMRLGNTRVWELTDQFDDPIGAYLCAELENWGRL